MNNQSGFIGKIILVVLLWVVGLIGWIMNIVRLIDCNFDPIHAEVVLRVIGIFVAPMGSVLGFFGHF